MFCATFNFQTRSSIVANIIKRKVVFVKDVGEMTITSISRINKILYCLANTVLILLVLFYNRYTMFIKEYVLTTYQTGLFFTIYIYDFVIVAMLCYRNYKQNLFSLPVNCITAILLIASVIISLCTAASLEFLIAVLSFIIFSHIFYMWSIKAMRQK